MSLNLRNWSYMMDPYYQIKATREWWGNPCPSAFHHICSMVTSQEISFSKGRDIRKQLYSLSESHGYGPVLVPKFILNLGKERLSTTGLSESRCQTLIHAAIVGSQNIDNNPDIYSDIKGIGPWTIKGTKLLLGIDENIVLYEDKWIKQRLGQLVDKRIVTETEAKNTFKLWPGHESLMSYFFWRAKPSAIDKMKSSQPLTRDDFV